MGNSGLSRTGMTMDLSHFESKKSGATFSECRRYRYTLWRWPGGMFCGGRYLAVIGLNPSTADETQDDPTIRRCIGFSRRWGFDGLCMLNLFAFRATDPADMKRFAEPVGELNDMKIIEASAGAGMVLAAWGVHGGHLGRASAVLNLMNRAGLRLHCLGMTKDGHPRHPLYVPGDYEPIVYLDNRPAGPGG